MVAEDKKSIVINCLKAGMELLNVCDSLDNDAKETFLKVRSKMTKMKSKVKEIIGTIEHSMRNQMPIEELSSLAKLNGEYFDESLAKAKECSRLLECIGLYNAGTFHQPKLQDQEAIKAEDIFLDIECELAPLPSGDYSEFVGAPGNHVALYS